jgi:hypothetical protein
VKAETGQNLLTKKAMVFEKNKTFLDVQSVLVETAEGPISVGTDLCATETVESVPGRRAAKPQPSVISCLECGKDFAKRSSLLFHQGKPLEESSPVPYLYKRTCCSDSSLSILLSFPILNLYIKENLQICYKST